MRILILVAMIGAAVFVACGGSSEPSTDDRQKALNMVMLNLGFNPAEQPPILNNLYACDIPVKTQPSPPATAATVIRGQCKWTVVERGTGWRVEYGEKWPCRDWSLDVAGWKTCQVPDGSHSWTFQVSLGDGTALRLAEAGTWAPDMPR